MWYIWLIASGIFFIVEIATTGFLIFWLAIAALIAMCVSFITDSILIQAIVFVVSSTILIPLTKPLVNKYIDKGKSVATNAFAIVGKSGIVTADINTIESTGQVKVDGEIWSAKSDINIPKGTKIEVVKKDGVKLIVKQKDNITV